MIQSPPQLTFLQTADKSDVCTKTNSPLTDDSTKHRVISRRSTGSWTVCCHDSGYKTGCFQRDLRASPVHLVEVGPPPAAFEVSVAVSKTVWLSTGKESKHIQVCDVSYVKARVLRWKHQLRWKQRCTCIIYSEYYLLRPGKRKKNTCDSWPQSGRNMLWSLEWNSCERPPHPSPILDLSRSSRRPSQPQTQKRLLDSTKPQKRVKNLLFYMLQWTECNFIQTVRRVCKDSENTWRTAGCIVKLLRLQGSYLSDEALRLEMNADTWEATLVSFLFSLLTSLLTLESDEPRLLKLPCFSV